MGYLSKIIQLDQTQFTKLLSGQSISQNGSTVNSYDLNTTYIFDKFVPEWSKGADFAIHSHKSIKSNISIYSKYARLIYAFEIGSHTINYNEVHDSEIFKIPLLFNSRYYNQEKNQYRIRYTNDLYYNCEEGTLYSPSFSGYLYGTASRAQYLKDRSNGTATYSNYGAAGLGLSSITWLTCWNGYELRAISKGELGGLTNVYQHTANNVDYPLVWSNQNNTSTVQANQLHKSYAELVYNPANKEIKTWSFAPQGENTNRGIHFPGGAWINSIGTSIIFRNATIRFGGSGWDWNAWAGLNFDGNTTINIGMPNNSHWTANSNKTAGTIRTVSSKIEIFPDGNSNFGEGLRIHTASNGWTSLVLCGTDNTGFNGTSANSWSLHTNGGNFYLSKNGSTGGTTYMDNISNKWYFNTTSGGEAVNIGGWVNTVGACGWYNSTYGGGMWMNDSTYVRVYNGKYLYTTYQYYDVGNADYTIDHVYASNDRFIRPMAFSTFGNKLRDSGYLDGRYARTHWSFASGSDNANVTCTSLDTWVSRLSAVGGISNYGSISSGAWWWVRSTDLQVNGWNIRSSGAMMIYCGDGSFSSGNYKHFLVLDAYAELYGITSNEASWKYYSRFLNNNNYTDFVYSKSTSDSRYLRKDTNDSTPYQYSFTKTNDHAIQIGTIRGYGVGSCTGNYLHIYERVHIGSPSGWGSRNAPSYGLSTYGGAWLATDTGSVGIGCTDPGFKLDVRGTGRFTARLYPQEWVEFTGYQGLYWPGANNAAHIYPNNATSYGAFIIRGSRGGYGGILLGHTGDAMHVMDSGEHKGFYQENQGMWIYYYRKSDQKVGIRTSSLDSQYTTIEGDVFIRYSTLDNTAFRNNLMIFGNNSNESSSESFTEGNASWGIGFRRQWSSGTTTAACAGIYCVPSGGWRAGLAFRVKNNQNASGATHDVTAVFISPKGALLQQCYNSWLSPARVQIGRMDTSSYSDRSCIGTTDGNLHIDPYSGHSLYLNYYCNATTYFNGSSYWINTSGQSNMSMAHLLINGATWWSNWNWSGQGGQPTWIWGSNDGTNMYVWNPSNFSVNYANYSGWSNWAHYLAPHYDGGVQSNPQQYFNYGIGLKVAMTGHWSTWCDTLWINGYTGGDVVNMCALHFMRNGTPRFSISAQSNRATAYGTYYEVASAYNTYVTNGYGYILGTYITKLYPVASNPDNSHPGYGCRVFYSWNTGQAGNGSSGYSNGITIGSHPNDQAYGFQIVQNMWDDKLYFRRYNGGWQSWRTCYDNVYHPNADYSSTVAVNNSDANSTYRMVWHSGNTLYSTGGIYCNPSSDYLYASSFYCGDWFRSSGQSGWYNESYGGGIWMTDSSWVRTYNSKGMLATCFYASNWASATYLLRSDGGAAAFNWSAQSGTPIYVWGGSSQHSYYIYRPSNFSVNYANYAGYAGYLKGPDNRSTNNAPSWYMTNRGSASLYGEFCQSGGAVSSTYEYRLTMTPWGDNSGQRPVQMAFNNYGAYLRTSSSDSAWNSWVTVLTSGNSSVSGGGSTWGSSITVKINGIEKTLTIPSKPSSGSSFSLNHQRVNNTTNRYVLGTTLTNTSASSLNGNTIYSASQFYFTNAGAYHSSDARKKYDIRDILNEDVNKLFETENGFIRHYKWKEIDKDAYGFIAQELQEYCPEAVDFNNDDGYYSVNYNVAFSKIIGAMFKKIKELERKLKENGIP